MIVRFALDFLLKLEAIAESFVLFQETFGGFADHYISFYSIGLHFIGQNHVFAVYIISDDIRADDSSDNMPLKTDKVGKKRGKYRVDSYPHVQFVKVYEFSHSPDDFYHTESHFHHVHRLFHGISLVRVRETHHHVAIADGVNLINFELQATFVEFRE